MVVKNFLLTGFCTASLLGALLLTGCKETAETGIDPSRVAPTGVTYDETNSTSTALGFYWEVEEAVAAGAVSFTAQIIKDEALGGDAYTGTTSTTLQAAGSPNDGVIFNGLTENSKYYARVRANYPRSIYSEWVYVTNDKGERAVIKTGQGIVDESILTITGAKARIVNVSSATAVVEWSVTDFSDSGIDRSATTSIELYKDEGCSDLVVSWTLADPTLYSGNKPRFIFSGLAPETSYWLVAEIKTVIEEEEVSFRSEPVTFQTLKSEAVRMGTAIPAGGTVLFQDFAELIWGGDNVNMAVGYSAEKRSSATALTQARGWNPVGGDLGYYLCTPATEMGLYNSIRKALSGSGASLAEWAELREDPSVAGMVAGRPGSVKIGASSKVGWLVTPALRGLTGTATVEVSFKASPYGSSNSNLDPLGACIRLLDGAIVTDNIVTSCAVNNVVETFTLANDISMADYSFTIHNVTPSSRIAIGPARDQGETGQHRMVLDDVCIKVISYGESEVDVETPVVTLSAGEGQIMANWNACKGATSYDVEYRKEGDSDWISAGNTTFTSMAIRGLAQRTRYEVRVRGKYSENYKSDWSEVVSEMTPQVDRTVEFLDPVVTESQIGWRWYTFADKSTDILQRYRLELYKDAACTDLVVRLSLNAQGIPDASEMTLNSALAAAAPGANPMPYLWNATTGACFLFSGLEADTPYTLKVTNKDLNISATSTVRTAASHFKALTESSAAEGSVILHEDFSCLVWGGLPRLTAFGGGMPGVNSELRSSLTSFRYISGEQPLADNATRLWLCAPTQDYGLLNTCWRAVASTSLSSWSVIAENTEGGAGALCGLAGMLKLGASNYYVQAVTPPLTCLQRNATLEVSFDMSPFTNDGATATDPLDAVIKVIEGGSVSTQGAMHQVLTGGTVAQSRAFTIDSNVAMKHYTFTLSGVKPGSRIAIGNERPAGAKSGQRRSFLDNVQIKVINYQ